MWQNSLLLSVFVLLLVLLLFFIAVSLGCDFYNIQVFKFGSVPLKTYLPDGDIDLTAFSKNQNLKETWAHQVRDILENEEKNENAEFRVKEVQYIQAEVGPFNVFFKQTEEHRCHLPVIFFPLLWTVGVVGV